MEPLQDVSNLPDCKMNDHYDVIVGQVVMHAQQHTAEEAIACNLAVSDAASTRLVYSCDCNSAIRLLQR